jgi:hypothetical protein
VVIRACLGIFPRKPKGLKSTLVSFAPVELKKAAEMQPVPTAQKAEKPVDSKK